MISNKNVCIVTIIFWVLVSLFYIARTPFDHRTHDFWGHLQYTEYIVRHNKFPSPYELSHSYYPPLYYSIAALINPDVLKFDDVDKLAHINPVRYMSVLYGAITLWIIGIALQEFNLSPFLQLILLLFISTTPKYVFVFATYNNDSLLTMLSVAALVLSYKLYKGWSWKFAIWLLVVATASLYTKYTSIFYLFPVAILCFKNFLLNDISTHRRKKILSILIMSIVLFTPWMYYHNYLSTKKLFPANQDGAKYNLNPSLAEISKTLSTVLKIPIVQYTPLEWSEPWSYPTLDQPPDIASPATKSYDYLSFVFVTSVIGEFKFTEPGEIFIWVILAIHLLMYLLSIVQVFKSEITKLSGVFIVLSHLMHLINIARGNLPVWGALMDFRYISFTWLAWAILHASVLANEKNWQFKISRILILGIIVQVYILMTVEGAIGFAF